MTFSEIQSIFDEFSSTLEPRDVDPKMELVWVRFLIHHRIRQKTPENCTELWGHGVGLGEGLGALGSEKDARERSK